MGRRRQMGWSRAWRVVALSCAALHGCGDPPKPANTPAPTPRAVGSTQSPAEEVQLDAPPPQGVSLLGAVAVQALAATLLPIEGESAVLVTHSDDLTRQSFVRRVPATGDAGPVVTLPDMRVVYASAGAPGTTQLVLVRGKETCFATLSGGVITQGRCHTEPIHSVGRLGEATFSLAVAPPLPDEELEEEAAKQKPAASRPASKRAPAKKKPPSLKPARKQGKGPKKKPPSAVDRMFSSGRELEVFGRLFDAQGEPQTELLPSGLVFTEPMAGMNLIGARGSEKRVTVVTYQKRPSKGRERRGSFAVARLDPELLLIEGSEKNFAESRLDPGQLADNASPRLVSLAEATLLFSSRGPRGGCDVTQVAPFVMQMIPVEADCRVEPRRFSRLAEQRRSGKSAELPKPPADIDLRRSPGQASWDSPHVVVAKDHAFGLRGDELVSYQAGDAPKSHGIALPVKRSRVFRATIDKSGSIVALAGEGATLVKDGKLESLGAVRFAAQDRPDMLRDPSRFAVRVASRYWQATGELVELPRAAAGPPLAAETIAIGGAEHGLLLDSDGAMLRVRRFDASGLRDLGGHTLPLAPGFVALEQPQGGALAVGRHSTQPDRLVAVRVDARGALLSRAELAHKDARQPFELRSHGRAGALLISGTGSTRSVRWIGPDLLLEATAVWPQRAAEYRCVDGSPASLTWPTAEAGRFQNVEVLGALGSCVIDWRIVADGTMHWVGSRVSGPHLRAEYGSAPGFGSESATTPLRVDLPQAVAQKGKARCPSDMVFVPPDLCVDRFEATLASVPSGRFFSPDYPTTPKLFAAAQGDFATRYATMGDLSARAMGLPAPHAIDTAAEQDVIAKNQQSAIPSGYVTGSLARAACASAQKRLCKLDEWRRACRGEAGTLYPYGVAMSPDTCNIDRREHPAAWLHGNSSIGHLDPRLNRAEVNGVPLLEPTGSRAGCRSRWGADAIYDMVGNLDEWVDEKGGAFAGGFFGRGTTSGCEALISNHPEGYLDYSTGVRCCMTAE